MAYCDWVLFLVVLRWRRSCGSSTGIFVSSSVITHAPRQKVSPASRPRSPSRQCIRVTQGFVRQQTNAGLSVRCSPTLALQRRARPHVGDPHPAARAQQPVLCGDPPHVRWLAHLSRRHDDGRPHSIFLPGESFLLPIAIIGNQYNQALVAMAGAERVFRLIDTPPDCRRARRRGSPRSTAKLPSNKYQVSR